MLVRVAAVQSIVCLAEDCVEQAAHCRKAVGYRRPRILKRLYVRMLVLPRCQGGALLKHHLRQLVVLSAKQTLEPRRGGRDRSTAPPRASASSSGGAFAFRNGRNLALVTGCGIIAFSLLLSRDRISCRKSACAFFGGLLCCPATLPHFVFPIVQEGVVGVHMRVVTVVRVRTAGFRAVACVFFRLRSSAACLLFVFLLLANLFRFFLQQPLPLFTVLSSMTNKWLPLHCRGSRNLDCLALQFHRGHGCKAAGGRN
mmetsp:Transcript_21564/g.54406  ORF Transcript_21564/g.54406 Transcript_21564/m.54406 type:complete len:256 (-) Transcript_21564:2333-3100(-)